MRGFGHAAREIQDQYGWAESQDEKNDAVWRLVMLVETMANRIDGVDERLTELVEHLRAAA